MTTVAIEYLHHKVDSETRSRQEETRHLRDDIQEAAESAGSAINELQRTKADASALSNYATLTGNETLTNKTLDNPTLKSSNNKTLTLPTPSTDETLATETYVNDQIGNIQIPPAQDLTDYVKRVSDPYFPNGVIKEEILFDPMLRRRVTIGTTETVLSYTFPDHGGEIITSSATQQLQNKTLVSPYINNNNKILTFPEEAGTIATQKYATRLITELSYIVLKTVGEVISDVSFLKLDLRNYLPSAATIHSFTATGSTTSPIANVTGSFNYSDGVLSLNLLYLIGNQGQYGIVRYSDHYDFLIRFVKDSDNWYVFGIFTEGKDFYILTQAQWEELMSDPTDLNPFNIPYPLSSKLKGKLASLEARIAALEQAVAALA